MIMIYNMIYIYYNMITHHVGSGESIQKCPSQAVDRHDWPQRGAPGALRDPPRLGGLHVVPAPWRR